MRVLFLVILPLLISSSILAQNDTINQVDENSRKLGHWIIYGIDKPQYGYPDSSIIEQGTYKNGRKNGTWIKYYQSGQIQLIANYKNNRPDGIYTMYYENGIMRETGTYRARKIVDTLITYNENGQFTIAQFYNVNGRKVWDSIPYYRTSHCLDSVVCYHHLENKRLTYVYSSTECNVFEESRTIDLVDHSRSSRIKPVRVVEKPTELKEYNIFTLVLHDSAPMEITVQEWMVNASDTTLHQEHKGYRRRELISMTGYNKVYNENLNIFLDGKFENGQLMMGKVYEYDGDGILLRIKVYKYGRYHSDGQL